MSNITVNKEILNENFTLTKYRWEEICKAISIAAHKPHERHHVYIEIDTLNIVFQTNFKCIEIYALFKGGVEYYDRELLEFLEELLKKNGIKNEEFRKRDEDIYSFLKKRNLLDIYSKELENAIFNSYIEDDETKKEIESKISLIAKEYCVFCNKLRQEYIVENNICQKCKKKNLQEKKEISLEKMLRSKIYYRSVNSFGKRIYELSDVEILDINNKIIFSTEDYVENYRKKKLF